jgi:hypothetical protein
MQRLLNAATGDPDGVRDDLRGYVVEHLGERGGVLIVDETGFLIGHHRDGPKRPGSGLIPLTLGEIRRLLAHLTRNPN